MTSLLISTCFVALGRTLIPRYFRNVFEGGVTDMNVALRRAKESFHNTMLTLDCDHAQVVTQHGKPMFASVSNQALLQRGGPVLFSIVVCCSGGD